MCVTASLFKKDVSCYPTKTKHVYPPHRGSRNQSDYSVVTHTGNMFVAYTTEPFSVKLMRSTFLSHILDRSVTWFPNTYVCNILRILTHIFVNKLIM